MFDPTRLTAVQLVALFDSTPRAAAAQLLRAGRILKAREVVTLCRIAQGGPITPSYFSHLVHRIGRRWTSAGHADEAHTDRGKTTSTSACPAEGPLAPASRTPPLCFPSVGEAANLPADAGEIRTEWTRTWFSDGREVRQ